MTSILHFLFSRRTPPIFLEKIKLLGVISLDNVNSNALPPNATVPGQQSPLTTDTGKIPPMIVAFLMAFTTEMVHPRRSDFSHQSHQIWLDTRKPYACAFDEEIIRVASDLLGPRTSSARQCAVDSLQYTQYYRPRNSVLSSSLFAWANDDRHDFYVTCV